MVSNRVLAFALFMFATPFFAAAGDFIASPDLDDAGLQKFWQIKLPIEAHQTIADVYLVDDQLYACTADGYVYAVQADTGAIRWMKRVTSRGYRIFKPCHLDDKRVVMVTSGELVVYDRVTGDGVYRLELPLPCSTGPVASKEFFFLGGSQGRLYACRKDDYRLHWQALTPGAICETMFVTNEVVCYATPSGVIGALEAYNKFTVWPQTPKTIGAIQAGVVHDDNNVYAASTDQSVWAFSRKNGAAVWRVRLSAPLFDLPQVGDELIYQYSASDGLVAIDPQAEDDETRVRWTLCNGLKVLTEDDKRVFVVTTRGTAAVVQKEDGRVLDEIPLGGLTRAVPQLDATAIYVADNMGRLFCARPKGEKTPRRADVLAALSPEKTEENAATDDEDTREEDADETTAQQRTPLGGKSDVTKGMLGD